jgi:hypothetical protein|tara:strand:+ start:281 stop:967 length:687 start_codon:yes stop_codon:yes gene_type:complete
MFTDQQASIVKNSKVCYLVPCFGGAVFEQFFVSFMKSVIDFQKNGLSFGLETVSNESLVTRARNTLIAKGMANKSNTHFMFIDADISFTSTDIFKLISADKDVIGGLYPKKTYPIEYVFNPLNGDDVVDEHGLQKVRHTGTGFMLIKRTVIEQMFKSYTELWYQSDLGLDSALDTFMYALFDTVLDEKRKYLSEDWTFCNRWRAIGGEIWVNSTVKLGHSGYHTFGSV